MKYAPTRWFALSLFLTCIFSIQSNDELFIDDDGPEYYGESACDQAEWRNSLRRSPEVVCPQDYRPLVDVIIFSYNRPMQLYALLESMDAYMEGLGEVRVIYRASAPAYETGYEMVAHDFEHVLFIKQSKNAENDFKPLTIQAIQECPSQHLMFAVDDIIVTDFVDLSECAEWIEREQAYGFFLRLGINTIYCYPLNDALQGVPPLERPAEHICKWAFASGRCDWNYPNTVDMTIYRRKDVLNFLTQMNYSAPNLLEGVWAAAYRSIPSKYGLCYECSKMVNIPANRVHNIWNNRVMNSYSIGDLLYIFGQGKKIDIKPFFQVRNKAAHAEYPFRFIDR